MIFKKKVAIALSGGIDSLVAAFLLKQDSFEVFGIHFTTGYESLPVDLDRLKSQLDIPVETIDLGAEFETGVVQYFIQSYLEGYTPNPCMICNKKIKFGALLDIARQKGADCLATGHYAGIRTETCAGRAVNHLVKGKDPAKEQSYFLAFLNSDQLSRVIFPLADLTKTEVKSIAAKNNLVAISEKESQDICFISNQSIKEFIVSKKKIKPERGKIVGPEGKIIGIHEGLLQFTPGQRRGINCPASEPYYVRQIDLANNRLVVCFKKDMMGTALSCDHVVWNCHPPPAKSCRVNAKIRYNHKESAASLTLDHHHADLVFDVPQFAITPGQGVVFYQEDRVLGAGIIQ